MSSPTPMPRAWASSRSGCTAWPSAARELWGADAAPGTQRRARRLGKLSGAGVRMTADAAARHAAGLRRTGVRRTLAGAGLRDGAGAAPARPVQLARMGRGAVEADRRGAGRRRCRPGRHLLPPLAGRAGSAGRRQGRQLGRRTGTLSATPGTMPPTARRTASRSNCDPRTTHRRAEAARRARPRPGAPRRWRRAGSARR